MDRSLPKAAKAAFKEAIEAFASRPLSEWHAHEVPPIQPRRRGLHKFKIRAGNVQYRPIGCYGPTKNEDYTILIITEEHDNKLPPRDLELAMKRAKDVERSKEHAVELSIAATARRNAR